MNKSNKSIQIKSKQMLLFGEREKPEYQEKNLSEQSREPTNSVHIWRRVRELNPGHSGGRQAVSPLRQPCSPSLYLFSVAGRSESNGSLESFENHN